MRIGRASGGGNVVCILDHTVKWEFVNKVAKLTLEYWYIILLGKWGAKESNPTTFFCDHIFLSCFSYPH